MVFNLCIDLLEVMGCAFGGELHSSLGGKEVEMMVFKTDSMAMEASWLKSVRGVLPLRAEIWMMPTTFWRSWCSQKVVQPPAV